jgi:hypothetical protein
MDNSKEMDDLDIGGVRVVKMKWVKPVILELVTHDGTLGTDLNASGDKSTGGS